VNLCKAEVEKGRIEAAVAVADVVEAGVGMGVAAVWLEVEEILESGLHHTMGSVEGLG